MEWSLKGRNVHSDLRASLQRLRQRLQLLHCCDCPVSAWPVRKRRKIRSDHLCELLLWLLLPKELRAELTDQ